MYNTYITTSIHTIDDCTWYSAELHYLLTPYHVRLVRKSWQPHFGTQSSHQCMLNTLIPLSIIAIKNKRHFSFSSQPVTDTFRWWLLMQAHVLKIMKFEMVIISAHSLS